ncbi:hypothetical protein NliqN6_0941 [Naganishia liquefaciens]|uniref:Uncharacterized protein n=1 Tax=Naganishia liquefaciens TaxID=104408 RepID=A0A8H3TPB8_9TREE|nr:hypothetical protein NliqN6_0941 [Naganishia liquefaciens]
MRAPRMPLHLVSAALLLPSLRLVQAHGTATPGDPMFTDNNPTSVLPTPTPTQVGGPTSTVDHHNPTTSRRRMPLPKDATALSATVTGTVFCPPRANGVPEAAVFQLACGISPVSADVTPTATPPLTYDPVHILAAHANGSEEHTLPVLCPPIQTYAARWVEITVNCPGPFAPVATRSTASSLPTNALATTTTSSDMSNATAIATTSSAILSLGDSSSLASSSGRTLATTLNALSSPLTNALATMTYPCDVANATATTTSSTSLSLANSSILASGSGRKRARPGQEAESGELVKASSKVATNTRQQLFKYTDFVYTTVSTRLAGLSVGPFHGRFLQFALRRLHHMSKNDMKADEIAWNFGLSVHISLLDAQPESTLVKRALEDLTGISLVNASRAISANVTQPADDMVTLPRGWTEVMQPMINEDIPTIDFAEPAIVPPFVLVSTTNLYLDHEDIWSDQELENHRDKRARHRAENRYLRFKAKVQGDAAERSRSRVKASVRQAKAKKTADQAALVPIGPPACPLSAPLAVWRPKALAVEAALVPLSTHLAVWKPKAFGDKSSFNAFILLLKTFSIRFSHLAQACLTWFSSVNFTCLSQLAWIYLAMPLGIALAARLFLNYVACISDMSAEVIAPWVPFLLAGLELTWGYVEPWVPLILDVVTTEMSRAIDYLNTFPSLRRATPFGLAIIVFNAWILLRSLPRSMAWPPIVSPHSLANPSRRERDTLRAFKLNNRFG